MNSLHELAQKLQKEILFCESEKERIEKEISRLQTEMENNNSKMAEHSLKLEDCLREIRVNGLEG